MPRGLTEIRADITAARRALDALPASASRRGLDQDYIDLLDSLLEEEKEVLASK